MYTLDLSARMLGGDRRLFRKRPLFIVQTLRKIQVHIIHYIFLPGKAWSLSFFWNKGPDHNILELPVELFCWLLCRRWAQGLDKGASGMPHHNVPFWLWLRGTLRSHQEVKCCTHAHCCHSHLSPTLLDPAGRQTGEDGRTHHSAPASFEGMHPGCVHLFNAICANSSACAQPHTTHGDVPETVLCKWPGARPPGNSLWPFLGWLQVTL